MTYIKKTKVRVRKVWDRWILYERLNSRTAWPPANTNGMLRRRSVGCVNKYQIGPTMNSPELIAKLALGNVISKELADRMLGVGNDTTEVASISRPPVPLGVDASDFLGPKCATGNATSG